MVNLQCNSHHHNAIIECTQEFRNRSLIRLMAIQECLKPYICTCSGGFPTVAMWTTMPGATLGGCLSSTSVCLTFGSGCSGIKTAANLLQSYNFGLTMQNSATRLHSQTLDKKSSKISLSLERLLWECQRSIYIYNFIYRKEWNVAPVLPAMAEVNISIWAWHLALQGLHVSTSNCVYFVGILTWGSHFPIKGLIFGGSCFIQHTIWWIPRRPPSFGCVEITTGPVTSQGSAPRGRLEHLRHLLGTQWYVSLGDVVQYVIKRTSRLAPKSVAPLPW